MKIRNNHRLEQNEDKISWNRFSGFSLGWSKILRPNAQMDYYRYKKSKLFLKGNSIVPGI